MAGKAKGELAPRQEAESSATFAGRQLNNRARALLAQAFDLLAEGRKRDGKDFVERLADELLEHPIAALERTIKLTPETPTDAGAAGNHLNIKSLYLMAVQGVAQAAAVAPLERAPEVLELEAERPGTTRVQPEASDW